MQEGDARVFQEVMTADSGPIGRQVVCPRPWMLPQDSWLLDGYEDQSSMPVRRCTIGDKEDADKPSPAGQTVGKLKIVGDVEPLSAWSDPDNPPILPGAKLESYEPHFRRRKSALDAKRAAARQVCCDGE